MSDIPFASWQMVLDAPRSSIFHGSPADTRFDRSRKADIALYQEALFTQSNGRILLGQAASGSLRFAALPTQVYPAPTAESEFGLGPGMYHHFDTATYIADLTYHLQLDNDTKPVDLSGLERDNLTFYADHFLPLTRSRFADLEIGLFSLAPLAADASRAALSPAPLPGPAGLIYGLYLRNTSSQVRRGKVILQAGDRLVGHYEDANPDWKELKRPVVDIRQNTLILTRPEGSAGIHLHGGAWTRLNATFQAECAFELQPGQEQVIESHLAMGKTYSNVMPVIYELHLRPALDWLNLTAAYWRSRLGSLAVDTAAASQLAGFSRDIYIRSLFDNFNCLQTDEEGNLISHWQGAPSHGYGTVWGIDVEPTAVSIAGFCPEMARQAMLFFLTRSRAPRGKPEHSTAILVAPVIIARQWLQASGDIDFLAKHGEVTASLQHILDDLLKLKAPGEMLFSSCYSSDGPVGRRYDYGTNVKAWYALDSLAYLLRQLDRPQDAAFYSRKAAQVKDAVQRKMVVDGPFGVQFSGGTNLSEEPGSFYLPEGIPYYDGEDTGSMLAPIYGFSDFDDKAWINYHRFARSGWCPNFDPEFEALRWSPGEYGAGALDGTAFFSRLGGSITCVEMSEALENLRLTGTDDATGSVFWWPHGLEYKRSLTRCSQGQGAWAWQYLQQWLGLQVDTPAHTLTLAPRGLIEHIEWRGFHPGSSCFDLRWDETPSGTSGTLRNRCNQSWIVHVGFRQFGAGAQPPMDWQTRVLQPGEVFEFQRKTSATAADAGMNVSAVLQKETAAFADPNGILFKRYGPAQLWGNWDSSLLWQPDSMPLTLRFVLTNGSNQDWQDTVVDLACPTGWTAQARLPRHWTPPDHMSPGKVTLKLGSLPSQTRTVAPFWIAGPHLYITAHPEQPFHAVSQPGDGLTLYVDHGDQEAGCVFFARLTAQTADGQLITKDLVVPIQIVPLVP